MSLRPISWSEAPEDCPGQRVSGRSLEFVQSLQQHLQGGLPPELALDLALHELVDSAAAATHASAAALALARGEELVCRATTGDYAPDLGIPLNTHTGLSGACLGSRTAQYCIDAEADERVDSVASRRLGIRSILVVPIVDGEKAVGIIEVFARQTAAFSDSDEVLLHGFARDCLHLQRASVELGRRPSYNPRAEESQPSIVIAAETHPDTGSSNPLLARHSSELSEPVVSATFEPSLRTDFRRRSRTDIWTLALATLVIGAGVGLTFLIGIRTGWLRALSDTPARTENRRPAPSQPKSPSGPPQAPVQETRKSAAPAVSRPPSVSAESDELVIYERGKVIYRSKPMSSSRGESTSPSASTSARTLPHIWLAPGAAEERVLKRIEPEYPAEARAAHRSGDVKLEIQVREDGSVSSVRTLNGDPQLAQAAAAAVRNWLYEPYQVKGRATAFRTDVTLTFSLPR